MAHKVKYRYRAYMPLDGTRRIVHVEALTHGLSYRFIAFEQSPHGLCVVGVRYAPDNALHLDVRKIDEQTIKTMLALHNHHDEDRLDEIEIVVGEPVRQRRGGIPDSREYGNSRRSSPHPYPFADEPVGNRWERVGRHVSPPFEDHDHASEE